MSNRVFAAQCLMDFTNPAQFGTIFRRQMDSIVCNYELPLIVITAM